MAKDVAVEMFGTANKTALFVGMGLVLLAVCAGIGLLARRRLAAGLVTFLLVGIVGVAAVLSRPGAAVTDILPTVAGVVVGALVLAWFNRDVPATTTTEVEMPGDLTRRSVLVGGSALAVLGALGIVAGRSSAEPVRRCAQPGPRSSCPALPRR